MNDDSMLLPIDVREEAFMMEANLPDMLISMSESGNYPGLSDEQLTRHAIRDINRRLQESQCYICLFANRKRVAFFWLTPVIARRYLSVRDSLLQLTGRTGELVGQEIAEVTMAPSYSHSSPLRPGGQIELIPRFRDKVHAFWVKADLEFHFGGSTPKYAFHLAEDTRMDLHWYPIPMTDGSLLDELYRDLQLEDCLVNVEPYEMPPVVAPFPPNARVTGGERVRRQQQYQEYVRAAMAINAPGVVRNPAEANVIGGPMEVTLTTTGLACNRMDYPQYKTPILTWKQIRKAIPKDQRKPQQQPGQPFIAKRRRVLVQRKEEE